MQEESNIREVVLQTLEALNNKDSRYFDLHDDALITHGLPGNFPANKEGMMKFYNELWRAFPDASFGFERTIVEGSNAACMFSTTGIQKADFMGVPPSGKEVQVNGMIFLQIKGSKITERWEIIDILSAAKQLDMKQQLFAVKNAILEYGEVKANKDLKDRISGLFGKDHD
jgi:steroid delta-isomerase-like uncharacterized protein